MKRGKMNLMRKTMMLLCLTGSLALAQDPLKVASGQYKLIAENDEVRILEGDLAPGVKTAMHSHPAVMAVILQPGVVKWTMPDGKTAQSDPKAQRGTVIALPSQTHVSENVGKTPLKTIIIEFKKPAPPAAQARKASSVASCKVIAESPSATAQLCTGKLGMSTGKHTHSAGVVYVALTDITAEITDDTGKTHTLDMKKDSAAIAAPETHSGKNIGKAAYQLIVVDLK
jgi:quercetin dioxygenase-like cupin family protein